MKSFNITIFFMLLCFISVIDGSVSILLINLIKELEILKMPVEVLRIQRTLYFVKFLYCTGVLSLIIFICKSRKYWDK